MPQSERSPSAPEYSEAFVQAIATDAREGDSQRGALVFASPKFACISCHQVGEHGGKIGPELSEIAKKRVPAQIVESLFWPKRHVEKEFIAHRVATADGQIVQGYLQEETDERLSLRDPATGEVTTILVDDIDQRAIVETLMPDGLTSAMSRTEQLDLICFLTDLGRDGGITAASVSELLRHASAHAHGPARFDYKLGPMNPEDWPHQVQEINRLRLYDFYEKQADHFRALSPVPPLLEELPGLEGAGAQAEFRKVAKEIDPRWNDTQIFPVLAGTFRTAGLEVPRGICVRLGDQGEMGVCFNPETLCYESLWQGDFLKFPGERRGFMDGLKPAGTLLPPPQRTPPDSEFTFLGYYRYGKRILFSYRIGDEEYLDSPWVEDGKFQRIAGPAKTHPLRDMTRGGPALWSEELIRPIEFGNNRPYAVDTIHLPFENSRNDLLFGSGVAFLPDGDALICTIQGDVWRATGFKFPSKEVRWRKVASGIHQALGIVADGDGVFVLGRDQITRLHDLNHDGEYDFHECFCNGYVTSTFGHDYICGLERDVAGNFYTASSKQGLLQISPDGRTVTVIATGFRNSGGVGVMADGTALVPCSQGTWTPASMVCAVRPPFVDTKHQSDAPYYGFGGPKTGKPPELPFVYLPRGLDNSSGGQATVTSDRWGPLQGQSLHFSFGACRYFLMLRDEVDGQLQGAVVPMVGDFRSGVQRGVFSPDDGQLYVTGQAGWGTFSVDDGCFERVRYTGDPVQLPVGFHVHENGVRLDFSEPLDPQIAATAGRHFAQQWNYRYSGAYGSPEYAPSHPGTPGHEPLAIQSAHVLEGGHSLFLEIPKIQPVNQLHLRLQVDAGRPQSLFLTVHKLDRPFTDFPGYQAVTKTIQPHPILADLAFEATRVPNPWRKAIDNARKVTLRTSGNLQFDHQRLTVKAGEVIQLTFINADVVPHNWALVKPGTLQTVGELSNQFAAHPDAYPRQYIPETGDVLAYVDIVDPGKRSSIYFTAPKTAGQYPYVCTFPGHWTVMHGVLTVTEK
ncbi:MAG TPA: plastocyanin/azurin family copper-binding protein [Planctomicrobium sp.]|nr:plastocyanin/azurin family copper-binding protein [Planctomicrobium sp.]